MRSVLVTLLCLFGALPASADPAPNTAPNTANYSPFGVVAPGLTVSFKDVGLRLQAAQQSGVLEAIAGGVAFALAAEAVHRPTWTQVSWHRQCRRQHIYVDLWRSTHPDRVGYSLWRGCGAEDRVDHAEVSTLPRVFEIDAGLVHAGKLGETVGTAIGRCVAQARC